jgi:hypothetical protein
MLEKKKTIESVVLIQLLMWLKAEADFIDNNKIRFKYDKLLQECMSNENVNVDLIFDDLMYDLFLIYDRLKKIDSDELENKLESFNIFPKDIIEDSKRGMSDFIELYEKLLMETKFEYSNMRSIQKNLMSLLIVEYSAKEEYEKCIELKKKLEEI